jgi:hypothetical protein
MEEVVWSTPDDSIPSQVAAIKGLGFKFPRVEKADWSYLREGVSLFDDEVIIFHHHNWLVVVCEECHAISPTGEIVYGRKSM